MGKGDKRTKRGKLFRGTTGKAIPGKKRVTPAKPEPKPVAAKTPRAPREPREPKDQPGEATEVSTVTTPVAAAAEEASAGA